MSEGFAEYLAGTGLARNTVAAYLTAVRQFREGFGEPTNRNLRAWKTWLIEQYAPRTVNLRLRAINCWLESLGRSGDKLAFVRVQQKPFLEHVISDADYSYLKSCLLRDGDRFWYFAVRFMAATGARVSELTQIKGEHVARGYLDLYAKGGKLRRIWFPRALREEALSWLRETGRESGFIFVNQRGDRITARGIAGHLKILAGRYGIDPAVMYPHSFRHRFAKSFLEKCSDIALLADLMGHESIETTRIYLRRTATEQRTLIDSVVDW